MNTRPTTRFTSKTKLLAVLLAVSAAAAGLAGVAVAPAEEPATEGIDWVFEPDNPSNKALIGFRKPVREVEEVVPGVLWIDAEDFTDYGGWWLDTKFVHLMGSAYLIANGVEGPVDDATITVDVPRKGDYRLWVRSRDWLPEHSPGQFRVTVDGAAASRVFGESGRGGWHWEDGGMFELAKGPATIALRDLTGHYGRCDALVLTTDAEYTPPNELEAIKKERARLTGLDLTPEPQGEYDVIVVGAGAAGCCAAIASARMGAETALIQNRPVLGGNASLELGVPICGAAAGQPNARETGIIGEAERIRTRYGYPKLSEPFRILAEQEENLSVFLNRHVFDAQMDGDAQIAGVRAVDTFTGEITEYRGRLFIDCTGDGWLGYFAGADYRFGRESREEFGEDLAPPRADEITMSGCIMGNRALCYRAVPTGDAVSYEPPAWALQLPSPEEFGRHLSHFAHGHWWLEHPGTFNDLVDAERARDELIRITYGFWDYVKNKWPEREKAKNFRLVYVPITDAKRETRRLMGDYILTQNDVLEGRVFPDRIAHGGWSLDVHHPEGILSGPEGPFDCNPRVPLYTIPYRCLYSRNVDNLLFAGRDASVTHIALGTVRVQGTLAALGQAAGTAAGLCTEKETTPRGLLENHLGLLQQTLLKGDQFIPEMKNQDPADLARKATVTASSTATFERFGREQVQLARSEAHELNMNRATMFPVGLNHRIESVLVRLRSLREEPVDVTLHVRGAEEPGDYTSTEDIATATATVPPGKTTWIEFPVKATVDAPFAWAMLSKTPGIEWSLMSSAPRGSSRAYGVGGRSGSTLVESQFYACYTEPPRRMAIDCAPENVINGVARPVGQLLNMWMSDPDEPMPQWIELDFGQPTRLDRVYLTFDTNVNLRHRDLSGVEFVPQSVRDYRLEIPDGDGWQVLAAVEENFQRRRVHTFAPVTTRRVRLTVLKTNGDPSARVFEVRAYDGP